MKSVDAMLLLREKVRSHGCPHLVLFHGKKDLQVCSNLTPGISCLKQSHTVIPSRVATESCSLSNSPTMLNPQAKARSPPFSPPPLPSPPTHPSQPSAAKM